MMRERFDRIEIIDLRGDIRRGERAGVEADQGVFNIMVGTAITLAIADGTKAEGEAAEVYYQDSWRDGLFPRQAKLSWLVRRSETGVLSNPVRVTRGLLDDMRPLPFSNCDLISLLGCFKFHRSGLQTKRDDLVYDPSFAALAKRVNEFVASENSRAMELFHDSRDRNWAGAKSVPFTGANIVYAAYRPLDRRYLYNHRAYGDFLRPELQAAWGQSNVCLYALPGGTGAGPAVWCHGLLPDYHAFRGSYGGYAFPLFDRRPEVDPINVNPKILAALTTAYGEEVEAEDVFDAILCLLSAKSYSLRFAEDLEDVFPHVAFPHQPEVFHEAVRVGREIRAVETFARPPLEAYRRPDFVRLTTEPRGNVAAVDYEDGSITLCDDGTGRITGLPKPVWDFSVSGYFVLRRWLDGRIGLPADLAIVTELRDICGRIAELIDRFAEADNVLEATLRDSLSREALGFGPAEAENDRSD